MHFDGAAKAAQVVPVREFPKAVGQRSRQNFRVAHEPILGHLVINEPILARLSAVQGCYAEQFGRGVGE